MQGRSSENSCCLIIARSVLGSQLAQMKKAWEHYKREQNLAHDYVAKKSNAPVVYTGMTWGEELGVPRLRGAAYLKNHVPEGAWVAELVQGQFYGLCAKLQTDSGGHEAFTRFSGPEFLQGVACALRSSEVGPDQEVKDVSGESNNKPGRDWLWIGTHGLRCGVFHGSNSRGVGLLRNGETCQVPSQTKHRTHKIDDVLDFVFQRMLG